MREDLMILDEINKQLSQMTESEINELNEKSKMMLFKKLQCLIYYMKI